jgi:hypothetical protein
MVGMRKLKFWKLCKKDKKNKSSKKTTFLDYILALVNLVLLFPFVYILSVIVAQAIRFFLEIFNEVFHA